MSNTSDLFKLLRRMPVFGGLSDSARRFILDRSKMVEVPEGESFFAEGDEAKSLFVLSAGSVVIEKDWQGNSIELRQLESGDCFGEMAIIDLQPRSASVRAKADCHAIEIKRATLHQLFKHNLEQYAIIMMNMGREVSRRLRDVSERLFELDQVM